MQSITHFVNGEHTAKSARTQSVFEPATGEARAEVSLASAQEVSDAIAVAKAAFDSWSQMTPLNRARILFKFKALVEANMDELAELITREHGKVLDDAKGELIRGLEVVEFACG
uniref:aldehyde dehydrogenase family protein n=1 Tax=Shewanella sp. TaxID=50422 RepID=UPI003562538B